MRPRVRCAARCVDAVPRAVRPSRCRPPVARGPEQLRFPVGPASWVEPPEHREPHSGIVSDDRGYLPRRDFGRESQPPHFLDIAPHRSKPLARHLQSWQRALHAICLRSNVDSPEFRRHAARDWRENRVRGVEELRDALRELGINRGRRMVSRPRHREARHRFVHAGFDRRKSSAHSEKIVNQPVEANVIHRDFGGSKFCRIGFAFVAQRIEFGGHDQCRRQTVEAFRVQRRRQRIYPVGGVRTVRVQNDSMPSRVSR